MRILKALIFISLYFQNSSFALEKIPETEVINICAEDAGWPPFSVLELKDGKSTGKLLGKNPELIKKIFDKYNLKYNIHIKPWKRCLYEGIHGNIQIVLDAASNEQRKKDYLLTDTIYSLTPVYLYLKNRLKDAPVRVEVSELKSWGQGCGQVGYIYDNFGFTNDELNLQSKDLQNLLSLISKKRCPFGLSRLEIFEYEKELYKNFSDVEYGNIINAKSEEFYWLLNRKYKYSKILKEIIDTEVHHINNHAPHSN